MYNTSTVRASGGLVCRVSVEKLTSPVSRFAMRKNTS